MPDATKIDPSEFKPDTPTRISAKDFVPDNPLGGKGASVRMDASISKGGAVPPWAEFAEDYALVPATMGLGATGGAAVGGLTSFGLGAPVGAAAGAGLGAIEGDALKAAINQRFFGGKFQPTLGKMAGSAALGAATEAVPGLASAAMRGMAARSLRKAASAGADTAEKELFTTTLPKAAEQYSEKTGAAEAERQTAEATAKAKAQIAAEDAKSAKARELAPGAAQKELETFAGRTPEQSAAVQTADPLAHAERRQRMQDAVFNPKTARAKELGQRFEKEIPVDIRGEELKNPDSLRSSIDEERQYMRERRWDASPKVRALMDTLAPPPKAAPDDPLELFYDKTDIANMSDQQRVGYRKAITENPKALAEAQENAAKANPPKVPTVGDLLARRSDALALMQSEKGPSRSAADSVRQSIDDALMEHGVKFSPELRAEYADYKRLFDKGLVHSVVGESEPVNYAKQIFSDQPQRAMQLMKYAGPQERASLRGLFSDYALELGPKGLAKEADTMKPSGIAFSKVMRTLFGDTPYSKLKPWMETEPNAEAWGNLLNSHPEVQAAGQQAYKDSYETAMKEIGLARDKKVRGAALDVADMLGPAGTRIKMQLRAAKTPEEAAKLADQLFSPIFGAVPQPMPDAANRVGMQTYRENKAIAGGLDIKHARERGAIEQLQKLAQHGDPVVTRLKNGLAIRLPILLGLAAGGMHSPYLTGMVAAGLVGPMLMRPRATLFKMLTDDVAATEFYRGISMPANTLNVKPLYTRMGRAMAKLAAREMTGEAQRRLGLSADIPPEGEGE